MLRAGAACLDITPPLGTPLGGFNNVRWALAIHDPLYVRAFALERDGAGVAVAVCDLIGAKRPYWDRAKERIARETGLSPDRVLISCTHTHTGPQTWDNDPYMDLLIGRVADAVRLAWEQREAAEVGWGRGSEARVAFNRRYRMRDSTVQTNPGVGNPDIAGPAAPIDPEVGVLGLRRPNGGGTIGLLANYALHYVGAGYRHVSADYFGYFSTLIQRLRGESFVAALSNGAAGDINNIDCLGGVGPQITRTEEGERAWSSGQSWALPEQTDSARYRHTERVAGLIAAAALWAWNGMGFLPDAPLGAAMTELTLQPRPLPTEAERTRARELQRRQNAGEQLLLGEVQYLRRNLNPPAAPPAPIVTWVQALRIGDLALVGVPGELLVELGLDIKARSPFAQTMVMYLANDSIGYIPGRSAFEGGGYEAHGSGLRVGEGERIADTAVTLLQGLYDR
jgi:hypothetical protein